MTGEILATACAAGNISAIHQEREAIRLNSKETSLAS
jgi:hypothetical protein